MQVSSGHRYTRKLMRCPGRKVHVCDSGGTFTEIRVSLAPVNRFSLLDSSSSPACTSPVRFGIKKRRAQQTRMKKSTAFKRFLLGGTSSAMPLSHSPVSMFTTPELIESKAFAFNHALMPTTGILSAPKIAITLALTLTLNSNPISNPNPNFKP